MESKRKQCEECPWKNQNKHSLNFQNYVEKMNSIGKIQNHEHACHMITSDVWGSNQKITKKNFCIGSCNFNSLK